MVPTSGVRGRDPRGPRTRRTRGGRGSAGATRPRAGPPRRSQPGRRPTSRERQTCEVHLHPWPARPPGTGAAVQQVPVGDVDLAADPQPPGLVHREETGERGLCDLRSDRVLAGDQRRRVLVEAAASCTPTRRPCSRWSVLGSAPSGAPSSADRGAGRAPPIWAATRSPGKPRRRACSAAARNPSATVPRSSGPTHAVRVRVERPALSGDQGVPRAPGPERPQQGLGGPVVSRDVEQLVAGGEALADERGRDRRRTGASSRRECAQVTSQSRASQGLKRAMVRARAHRCTLGRKAPWDRESSGRRGSRTRFAAIRSGSQRQLRRDRGRRTRRR